MSAAVKRPKLQTAGASANKKELAQQERMEKKKQQALV